MKNSDKWEIWIWRAEELKKDAETETRRSTGMRLAAAEEGKFHVSVWDSQEDQIFGIIANVSPIKPEQHRSPCFFIMGQKKPSFLRLHWPAASIDQQSNRLLG